jgi:hypothetical protein
MCWCNPNIRSICCGGINCNEAYYVKQQSKEKPVSKELLKQCYKKQVETVADVFVKTICNQLANGLTGKQMLEIQNLLKNNTNVEPLLDLMVGFIVQEAKLTEEEIEFVAKYMETEVAQRFMSASLDSHKFLEDKGEELLTLVWSSETISKLEDFIVKAAK